MTGRTKRARKPTRVHLARLRGLVRAKVIDTAFQGVFDPLVGFGLATKERLPLEYRDVYRFRPTAKGKKEIGEP